jgi:hypothetical protein
VLAGWAGHHLLVPVDQKGEHKDPWDVRWQQVLTAGRIRRRWRMSMLAGKAIDHAAPPDAGPIVKLKVRLLEISPMVWRRLLVPVDTTLRELHGILQVAMGWAGIHLFQFHLRAVRYGSPELSAAAAAVTLASFRLRTGSRFTHEYDLNILWRHENRVERQLERAVGRHYPICLDGHGDCPAEECGGPADYLARQHEAVSFDAMSDLAWAHVNLLGEYDFSDEKLRDSFGLRPARVAA